MTDRTLKAGNTLQQESLNLRKSFHKELNSISRELFLLSYSLDVLTMVTGRDDEPAQNENQSKEKNRFFPSVLCSSPIFQEKNLNRSEPVVWGCLFVCLWGRGCLFILWRVLIFLIYISSDIYQGKLQLC